MALKIRALIDVFFSAASYHLMFAADAYFCCSRYAQNNQDKTS
jgi:hypothetical protein